MSDIKEYSYAAFNQLSAIDYRLTTADKEHAKILLQQISAILVADLRDCLANSIVGFDLEQLEIGLGYGVSGELCSTTRSAFYTSTSGGNTSVTFDVLPVYVGPNGACFLAGRLYAWYPIPEYMRATDLASIRNIFSSKMLFAGTNLDIVNCLYKQSGVYKEERWSHGAHFTSTANFCLLLDRPLRKNFIFIKNRF